MILLRCTAKLRKLGGWSVEDPPADSILPQKVWYANLVWIESRKCILFTHGATLYSVLVMDIRKRDILDIRLVLEEALFHQFIREGIDLNDAEPVLGVAAGPLVVGVARDRSVLGSMNDLAFQYAVQIEMAGGLAMASGSTAIQRLVAERVNSCPMSALKYKRPGQAIRELLGYD